MAAEDRGGGQGTHSGIQKKEQNPCGGTPKALLLLTTPDSVSPSPEYNRVGVVLGISIS
jgi:hypothetical protein